MLMIGRGDRRMATQVAAHLETLDEPLIRETVSIEKSARMVLVFLLVGAGNCTSA